MPTNYHKIVLGILSNIPKGMELYRYLVSTPSAKDLPILLTDLISEEHDVLLREAGLTDRKLIGQLQLRFANSEFTHQPQELFQQLIDHNPELFWSLVDDHVSQGHILIAQSLQGIQDAETRLIKQMLRHCNYRLHVIDLP